MSFGGQNLHMSVGRLGSDRRLRNHEVTGKIGTTDRDRLGAASEEALREKRECSEMAKMQRRGSLASVGGFIYDPADIHESTKFKPRCGSLHANELGSGSRPSSSGLVSPAKQEL